MKSQSNNNLTALAEDANTPKPDTNKHLELSGLPKAREINLTDKPAAKQKAESLAFDVKMLDNFQYGGPNSVSNNAMFSSPDKIRDTKTTS